MFIPNIIANTNGKEHSADILSHEFTKHRIIHLNGEVNTESGLSVCSQIRYLASKSEDDIYLFINSPGGKAKHGI